MFLRALHGKMPSFKRSLDLSRQCERKESHSPLGTKCFPSIDFSDMQEFTQGEMYGVSANIRETPVRSNQNASTDNTERGFLQLQGQFSRRKDCSAIDGIVAGPITEAYVTCGYDQSVVEQVEQMAQDEDKQMTSRKDEFLQKELDRFMENAIGQGRSKRPSWIHFS